MSLNVSCTPVSQKRTLSSLLAGRVVKRPKQADVRRLQEAAIQLLEQQQNLSSLFREVGNPDPCNIFSSQDGDQEQGTSEGIVSDITGSLLVGELRRQAEHLGVSVTVLLVKMVLERLKEITEEKKEEEERREMLTDSQRVRLFVLLKSTRELQSQGVLCSKLLWQEFSRDQSPLRLEVVYHLHFYNILTLKHIIESDEDVKLWLVPQLKALCGWTPPQEEQQTKLVQQKVLSALVGVLVGSGFERSDDPTAADRRISPTCCSVLDDMIFWLLDAVDTKLQSAGPKPGPGTGPGSGSGPEQWIQIFDASLCGVSASAEAVQRFFTHSLTQTLTYKPRLTVSDAVSQQNQWIFSKADRLLTSLYRKLAVMFDVEQLLNLLQQVLETHEVNWKHVLSFISTLLVYSQSAQSSLRDLLSRLLNSAFEGYDLENMITAFLLARQASLEGPGIFSSYSDWFKMSFGGGSSFHANSKKSLVFLLKFLSDLVPFEPPQYLKVHILHPPFVPVKHRSLLMEYVSLAKTRLADLKESVEEMGLYEDVSAASVQPQCQAVQDVEKAVNLFDSTGRISATVMEASIFRRSYFLTRFLPALLTPRPLPVKADARMSFIEALKKADKIPAAQYSSYVESCQKQRQQNRGAACSDVNDDPLEVLEVQMMEFTELVVGGDEGEISAHLSRISHTLSVVFPGRPDDLIRQTVIKLNIDAPQSSELHVKVVNMILRNFCQCVLDTSRANPPNKQTQWASRFISALVGNSQLLCCLVYRLWELFHNQASSLSSAHVLGLAVFMVHLHASTSNSPQVQLPARLVSVGEALSSALSCSKDDNMLFCVRLCVAAVCYGICRTESLPHQQLQEFIPSSIYKKLLYLIPRLLPETRRTSAEHLEENLWSSVTDGSSSWRETSGLMWRNVAFQQLGQKPEYQLLFSDWLENELRVQRSEDVLNDAERQEYQQWVCLEFYLSKAEEEGGCGGNMKTLCSLLIHGIMDKQSSEQNLESFSPRVSESGGCLPDIMSRLQEVVYEMQLMDLHVGDVLLEVLFHRFSSSSSSNISSDLSLQRTLHTWNSVLLTLPAVLLVKLTAEGGKTTLDCSKLIQHVNQHQRQVCSPVGLLSSSVTSHLLRGLLCASLRCRRPAEEFNRSWSQISVNCPLLLVSTAFHWQRLSAVLSSLWLRLTDGDSLPEQLQIISDCQNWSCSLERGQMFPTPPAAALLSASSLHRVWRRCEGNNRSFRAALDLLRPERDSKHKQMLVFLFFLCVNDFLSSLLHPQEKNREEVQRFCSDLLNLLVDSPDWLLVFRPNDRGVYQSVAMVTSDGFARLMPWAFCSLLLHQSPELLLKALSCPGFLHTSVLCYLDVLQLFLDGETPPTTTEKQVEPSEILNRSKQFILTIISQSTPAALSSRQLRQLQSQCADVDPDVAAALSLHLDPQSLSPEMDFL